MNTQVVCRAGPRQSGERGDPRIGLDVANSAGRQALERTNITVELVDAKTNVLLY